MRPFDYIRPTDLQTAVGLLARHGQQARVLAGGTDLVIRLRDGTYSPAVVVDVKGIPELTPSISEVDRALRISAGTTMTDVCEHGGVRASFPALVEAARIVGSIQIRNRATLVGNLCNASPAADTAPAMLVYGAILELAGPNGRREVALDDFFVRSGVTTLGVGELVVAVRLPLPAGRLGSAFERRTRRRGHDLASVTLAVALEESGGLRLAFGSLGPRPLLLTGVDAAADELVKRAVAAAQPSPTSMRAGAAYRVAMLHVLAERALANARARLAEA